MAPTQNHELDQEKPHDEVFDRVDVEEEGLQRRYPFLRKCSALP